MRTRRYRNKTKNYRKRGGALGRGVIGPSSGSISRISRAVEGVRKLTRKYFSCCRPGQQPDDGNRDGVAATTAAAGVGPGSPPGSHPFTRHTRGSHVSPVSPDASCVPCPQGSSRPPSRPNRLSRAQQVDQGASALRALSPQPPESGTPTRSFAQPVSDAIINECKIYWTNALATRRATMAIHLNRIESIISSSTAYNEQTKKIISILRRDVIRTAHEIMPAVKSLQYWTDVLNRATPRPLFKINPDLMDDNQWNRVLNYRSKNYNEQLRDMLAALPSLKKSNISLFRKM